MTTRRRNAPLVAAGAVIGLAVLSTIVLAGVGGAFSSRRDAPNGQCSAPDLPGTVVDVRLTNMGLGASMMGAGWTGGTMRIVARRSSVPAGTVSFRVANLGSLVHELVVLPLGPQGRAGERPVGSDQRVDETTSAGEAANTCGAGSGDGIAPGGIGWTTLNLTAGDYELVCNLPDHYAAGMHTTIHVG